MEYVIVALPGLIAVLVMKYLYHNDITHKEFFIHFLVAIASGLLCLALSYAVLYSDMIDHEILNGEVTDKVRHVEICTEYSSCKNYIVKERCRTTGRDSKGKAVRTCTSYKKFDYSYEVDWFVYTSVGDRHTIKRVNRQGTVEPSRYTQTKVGDPAATTNTYVNYLLGSEDSLFYAKEIKDLDDTTRKALPSYPSVSDYYKVNHVVNLTTFSDAGYNDYINNVLRKMGKEKQVNLVVVLYDAQNNQLPKHVVSKWRGGKKNDVIMFFGLDAAGDVSYFSSTSFAKGMKNELLHAQLRMDSISEKMSLQLLQHNVELVQKQFNRLPNQEFKFLVYKLQPTTGAMLFCSVLSLILSVAFGVYLRNVDL